MSLTLTLVVFESDKTKNRAAARGCLTLTLVVFECSIGEAAVIITTLFNLNIGCI